MLCVTHSPETKYLNKDENKRIKKELGNTNENKARISAKQYKKKSNSAEKCNSQWTYYSYEYLCTKHYKA